MLESVAGLDEGGAVRMLAHSSSLYAGFLGELNLRHERCGDAVEEQRDEGGEAGDGGAQTATAGEEAGEEGADHEEE